MVAKSKWLVWMLDVSYHFSFVQWMFCPEMFLPGRFHPTGCFVPGGFVTHICLYR